MKTNLGLITYFLMMLFLYQASGQSQMVLIKGGKYIPLYGRDSLLVSISDFQMDVYPVTNQEFLEFVKKYPKWQRSSIKKLFADGNYLINWKSDSALGDSQSLKAPITNISWFVANDYCECQGKRLPTVDEWEYAAMANKTHADARTQESYNAYILGWYELLCKLLL
jgi:formylglycine-generating enzyme